MKFKQLYKKEYSTEDPDEEKTKEKINPFAKLLAVGKQNMKKHTELGGNKNEDPSEYRVKYDEDGNEIPPEDGEEENSQGSEEGEKNSDDDNDLELDVTLSDNDSSESSSSDSDQRLNEGDLKKNLIVEYPLSERTELQDKLLFIHLNKNKFYIAKILESVLYNIIRMAIMWMAFNAIFSSSVLNLLLVGGCYYLSKKKSDIFLNMSTRYYVLFCAYFIVNWVLFRNKFIEKQTNDSIQPIVRWFVFIKTRIMMIKKDD